jgi:hypothetical protein
MPRLEYSYQPAERQYQGSLPRVSVETDEYRKGSTKFSSEADVTDSLSVSGSYKKNTDGGKDEYGARLTFRKSF